MLSYLDLAFSLKVEHRDRVHLPRAVGSGTGSEEEVTIRVDNTLVLKASPAGWMVGYGAALRASQEHMTFVLWGGGDKYHT